MILTPLNNESFLKEALKRLKSLTFRDLNFRWKIIRIASISIEKELKIETSHQLSERILNEKMIDYARSNDQQSLNFSDQKVFECFRNTIALILLTKSNIESEHRISHHQFKEAIRKAIFLHYNAARIQSIVAQFNMDQIERDIIDCTLLSSPQEWDFVWIYSRKIELFQKILLNELFDQRSDSLNLNFIGKSITTILELSKKFSSYYRSHRILLDYNNYPQMRSLVATRIQLLKFLMSMFHYYFDQISRI